MNSTIPVVAEGNASRTRRRVPKNQDPMDTLVAAVLSHHHAPRPRLGDVQIAALVLERPDDAVHLVNELLQRLAALGHEFPNGEAHPDAVALGDVALDRDAAALLPAQQYIIRDHDPADPLESDLGDLVFEPIVLAHLLHLRRGAHGHHHLAGELLVLHQVVDQQQDNVV